MGRLSTDASSDDTWGSLVYRRFCVNPEQSQAREHGGTLWKDAFRTMSLANRVPTCRYTCAPKVIVAQGNGGNHCDQVSSWVLVSHRVRCRTRRSRHHGSTRFIKFHVCLQNTKSGAGSVTIDLLGANFAGLLAANPLYGKPLILYTSTQDGVAADAHALVDGLLVLRAFEFCVIAMTFPCGYDVLETDVLKHARSLVLPLASSDKAIKATFIDEDEIWKYYRILPGDYLVLEEDGY